METRMEKYRKFREEIRLMADESFPQSEGRVKTSSPSDALSEMSSVDGKNSPYHLYAKRLRKRTLIVLGLFFLALIGFAVWFFLLQGRKA